MKGRIYVRLSDHSSRSIEGQIEDCKKYAKGQGIEIDHVYNEGENVSGWDESREEYQQMLSDAESGEFDALIVRDGSRLGRDHKERIRRFFDLDDWGVEFHTKERGYVDPEQPSDILMEIFQAVSDDHSKRREVEQLEKEKQRRENLGYYSKEPPTGLEYDQENQYLTNGDQFKQVLEAIQLRERGATYSELEEEFPWSRSTISKILDRREKYRAVENGAKLGYNLDIVWPDGQEEVAIDGREAAINVDPDEFEF